MTNTKKLQGKMREHGHTIKSLSDAVGLSPTGLFNKIHNQQEFLVSEVVAICKALCIGVEESNEIFFASNVELKATTEDT